MAHHLAQVNIARLLAPLEDPQLAGFVANLGPVNALADDAPGFIWRLQGEGAQDATGIEAFGWDAGDSAGVIVNMSVWADIERLSDFVYGPMHRAVLRQRREWFEAGRELVTACWWLPAGTEPTTGEAEQRLRHLRAYGPTPWAFTLREHFPPPAEGGSYLPAPGQLAHQDDRRGSAQLC